MNIDFKKIKDLRHLYSDNKAELGVTIDEINSYAKFLGCQQPEGKSLDVRVSIAYMDGFIAALQLTKRRTP